MLVLDGKAQSSSLVMIWILQNALFRHADKEIGWCVLAGQTCKRLCTLPTFFWVRNSYRHPMSAIFTLRQIASRLCLMFAWLQSYKSVQISYTPQTRYIVQHVQLFGRHMRAASSEHFWDITFICETTPQIDSWGSKQMVAKIRVCIRYIVFSTYQVQSMFLGLKME